MTTPIFNKVFSDWYDSLPYDEPSYQETFEAGYLNAMQSQAERIKELESECEVERLRLAACGVAALGYFDGCKDEYKSASLDDVLRLNKRCTDLRAELGDLPEAQAEMLAEIKQLRAQLAEIAAAEPVGYAVPTFNFDNSVIKPVHYAGTVPLFTRPMPADVTELVEALEMIVSTHQGHCEHHVGVSKHSYNLADIAEEALSKYKGAKQ